MNDAVMNVIVSISAACGSAFMALIVWYIKSLISKIEKANDVTIQLTGQMVTLNTKLEFVFSRIASIEKMERDLNIAHERIRHLQGIKRRGEVDGES